MEIALLALGLGGLYVVSNQKKEDKETMPAESFVSMGAQQNALPNTNIPPQNYPITNLSQLSDTVGEYSNPNTATDKYFNQNVYEQRVMNGQPVEQNLQKIYSMSGEYLDSAQFKHNNMTPFNGGKVKGNNFSAPMAESQLDNMVGSGSQVTRKLEQAPLFKPQENISFAYGTPINNDFYQSRVNPAMNNNNVKPFESIRVGPGLNQGYGTEGVGGFNAGMMSRDSWLPKTVDQMRTETNPKLEYMLVNHEGPANAQIKNMGELGAVEKRNPDSFFINTQDRWLTTTGAEKGNAIRPHQELGIIRKNTNDVNYFGVAGASDAQYSYAPQNYEPSTRVQLPQCDIPHSHAPNRAPMTDGDYGMNSMKNVSNNRSTVKQPDTIRSGFSGAIGAVIAPIMDVLKPTRKEETVHNIRIFGDVSNTASKAGYTPQTIPLKTTIKETTMYSASGYVNNQKEGTYVNNYLPLDPNQRSTTSCGYIGNAGGSCEGYGDMSQTAAYNQHNNDIKSSTIDNRPNMGGTQIFNQAMNVNCAKQDCNRMDYRTNPAISVIPLPPATINYGKLSTKMPHNADLGYSRINPDMLNAFRDNPYTHSLTTSV